TRPPTTKHFPYTTLFRSQVTYIARWQPDCIVGRIPNRGADTSTAYVGVYWSVEVLAWAKDDCAMSWRRSGATGVAPWRGPLRARSEEHTSELQSRGQLVC